MEGKDKNQLNIFRSVQPSKDAKEKYFKVERGVSYPNNNKINNNSNPALNKKFDNSQDTANYFFITNKNNINDIPYLKKGHKQNNNYFKIIILKIFLILFIFKNLILFLQQQIIKIKMFFLIKIVNL